MQSIAIRQDASLASWGIMKEQASLLVKSNFLPVSVKTPEQAIAIMMKGQELGIPPMQAFSQINVIQGKPCVSAELQLALIYRSHPEAKIEFVKLDIDGCHISAARPKGKAQTFKFERSDAEAAQLLSKDNWRKYPRAMYRSRCISEMARSLFPDAIMGCSYTPEELGAEVDEDGAIVDVPVVFKPPPPVVVAKQETIEAKPTVAGIYEGSENQQKIVMGILRSQNVQETYWEEIDKRLMGRPSTALKSVIAEVIHGL